MSTGYILGSYFGGFFSSIIVLVPFLAVRWMKTVSSVAAT